VIEINVEAVAYAFMLKTITNSHLYSFSDGFSNPDFELLYIEFVWYGNHFIVGILYHPPKPIYSVAHLIERLNQHIDSIFVQSPDSIFILSGDINSLNDDFLLRDHGLIQIVTDITHGKRTIDNFFQ